MFDLALSPVISVVAAVLAANHALAGAVGLPPGSSGAWLLGIFLLVIAVRAALVPLVVHSVRSNQARARALPQLSALRRTNEGTRDLDSLRRMRVEQRRIHAEHGVSRWSLAPALLQLPVVYALYRVVSDLTAGHAVGALDAGLVASASAASVAGLHLTSRIGQTLQQGPTAVLVLVGLAVLAAALSFATQRWFTLPLMDLSTQPASLGAVQHLMPWLAAGGILVAAAYVPVGLLVYWVVNNAWTFGQQALIWRYAPTPGSPAARRRHARRAA
ncbi:MAG: membrane protein insertase YidC [Humibacillus sp.]|nr:membrane protein insertase YidC [Humibacillus sp.]MDN5776832.1 membrane protein insertase YidC [Humibacillus sp.]